MVFTIYPAIDIKEGKCVRLFQGDYNLQSTYYNSPLEPAQKWYEAGAKWLHIIDLDGAKSGQPANLPAIEEILSQIKINIQIGGGIRNIETAQAYLEIGANRVIVGSQALKDKKFIEELINKFGSEKVVVSLDGRREQVYSDGWLKESGINLFTAARQLVEIGIQQFIYTDIERDGTLSGPNLARTLELAASTGKQVIVAGGISSESDVEELARCQNSGVSGAIIGRALYTGNINLKTLISQLGSVSK
ncbi:MAG: 1-(5-phosphoribosyl)-5-[(5-phosphoribosylamino)methylideneamino]imidazole-4-carboxamide isomerase [Peptococcales bacterium]